LEQPNHNPSSAARVYWRVEGSLADLTTVRPVAFFTWNAQTFLERWVRRGLVLMMAVLRPFLYAANRIFATRTVHTVLRGISRDRLDFLGEEYFKYELQPYLKVDGIEELKLRIAAGDEICHNEEVFYQPLAAHLGHAMPAVTLQGSYRGNHLGMTWNDAGRRGAFVGQFAL